MYEGGALKNIHAVLQSDHGLTITFKSFKVALHRVRKEQGRTTMPNAEGSEESVESVGSEPEASQQPQAAAPKLKYKICILSTKDIRPSPEVEAGIERIASKKYD